MEWITFTTFGSNSAFGSFAPGDQMRVGQEMATHLVDTVRCAVHGQFKTHELQAAEPGPAGKPSDGLNVAELKEALASKSIAVPEGVTKKADLAALLDGAA
ncbi:hypothetical protein [Acidovorax sp.]|uniref:hypothetical protein n=1 Tax=Acidovorax sp. TaxID=1872122 RepID=UPI002ACE875F|nr:hypothetical protein [Acidovorax sp.]MDZ7863378.1 hypothetical protein [Acidovorax sp.]